MARHNIVGKEGENLAAEYLFAKGFIVRESNWKSGKSEIDLIVENEACIVFVEVKTRSTAIFGDGLDAITENKQRMILDGAHEYIVLHNVDKPVRFDVISIVLSDKHLISHYPEAFAPEF